MTHKLKITWLTTTEEFVLNPDYKGLRTARLECWTTRNEHYAREPGRISVWNDDELFETLREHIELGHCWLCYTLKFFRKLRAALKFNLHLKLRSFRRRLFKK